MMKLARLICLVCLGSLATMSGVSYAGQAAGQTSGKERFEVSGIKAVRPTLVNTIAALKKGDAAKARAAFDDYDSAWNGIEMFINTRDKDMYNELEHHWQAKIDEGLKAPQPDTAALLADAQTMLTKYDEAIAMVEKAAPLNPLYDDVARLRMVRAYLREVGPALKAGEIAKARKSFGAFEAKLPSVEGLIKARSAEADNEIKKGTSQIKSALMADKPEVDQTASLVNGVMEKYNGVVADVTKDARSR
jgi:tetratricopeptide (TPR) repeat protein